MPRERSQGTCAQTAPHLGVLFIVGVPIGHPDDLTIRALATLREVDLIAAKNPQSTQALLSHHGVSATVTTYDRNNAAEKTPILLDRLRKGLHIALVSDCGMPGLYDPGRVLIAAALKEQIPIEVIPGTSAVVAATAMSGMDGNAFVFEGRCSGGIRTIARRLQLLRAEQRTMIFLPPVKELGQMLALISGTFGNRHVVLAFDLTKKTQTIVRGRVRTLLAGDPIHVNSSQVTLIVEGATLPRKGTRKRA